LSQITEYDCSALFVSVFIAFLEAGNNNSERSTCKQYFPLLQMLTAVTRQSRMYRFPESAGSHADTRRLQWNAANATTPAPLLLL